VKGPYWSYPGKDGSDPDWGLWTGGADGDSSLGWSSPSKTGDFQIRVNGQIVCGNGSGGQPIAFSAGWDGSVDFNADIKVRRKDSGDDYSSSATVAAGGIASSEHQADVQVTATDSDGNPMSGISVPAPTIQDDTGVDIKTSISPSSVTSDATGKADFTLTSSDEIGTDTLTEDGGMGVATAIVNQPWGSYSWDFSNQLTYDDPSKITFKLQLTSGGTTPVTSHDIHFLVSKISGWVWNSDTDEYDPVPLQDYETIENEYGSLVTYSNNGEATEDPESPGSYDIDITIHQNSDFLVDVVEFDVNDWNVWRD
jgi:hypothetical protein